MPVLYHVNHTDMSFNLRRLPSYPEYTIEFAQWSKESGGGAIIVGAPYAVRIFHTLSWPAICRADRDNWETFFMTIARAQSEPWQWYTPVQGYALSVRFADPDFPATPEITYGYHKLLGLRLMINISYSAAIIPTGTPVYNASMGTALSVGSVVMQFPAPVRPITGYKVATRYTSEDSSAGQPVIYRVGNTIRRTWTLSWNNLTLTNWFDLQLFFCGYVRGMKTTFTWYDTDGTARIVRLAQPQITVKQSAYNRYSCEISIWEVIVNVPVIQFAGVTYTSNVPDNFVGAVDARWTPFDLFGAGSQYPLAIGVNGMTAIASTENEICSNYFFDVFSQDQYCSIVPVMEGAWQLIIGVRCSPGNGYWLGVFSYGAIYLGKIVDSVQYQYSADGNAIIPTGSVITLMISGTNPTTLSALVNGEIVLTIVDTENPVLVPGFPSVTLTRGFEGTIDGSLESWSGGSR